MKCELIGIAKDGKAVVENIETGEIKKVDPPLFSDSEVVTTSPKHFSQKPLTRLLSPSYVDGKGWIYVENYIDENGNSGGCGMWFNEDLYRKLDTTDLKLKARGIEIAYTMKQMTKKYEDLKLEAAKISYALSL